MPSCPMCTAPLGGGSRFCSSCGAPASTPSQMPTAADFEPGSSGAPRTPGPGPVAAFAPGHVLSGRYRIVGLLGRGGMGEVFRADDLKLGAPVALKFLPRDAERDPVLLERFHAEVRNARQVSHPHVCRVYDIGEAAGRQFLSMEYVDGEDLATLLRRIGRLPPAKAVEIARQLAAGLAAAHDKGVLHRDLKPANVMIDGRGRARITDFGLAVLNEEARAELAGTPAYMAPELLAGAPATVQSDLYALGLVLYELFTGKRTFDAGSVAEWRRVHSESAPTSPSLHTADMDPAVERVILRCLEKDPASRPRSASQVALALPGGDPLAAALAAGETPSPEMVAAAGGEGGLSTRSAWLALGALLVLFAALLVLMPASTDLGLAPMEKSPSSLRDRAREIVRGLGWDAPAADETSWLERDYDSIRWLADNFPSTRWRSRLHALGAPVHLHYRRSDGPLLPRSETSIVTATDPPADVAGEVHVVVDSLGRLHELRAMPPRFSRADALRQPLPEAAIFRETGLDPARFEIAAPQWVPPVPFDERREWTGTRAEAPEIPLRLRAAAFEGRVVSVAIHGPWVGPEAEDPLAGSVTRKISEAVLGAFLVLVLGTAAFVARRNLRLGRGDRRGALRVALGLLVLFLLAWLPQAHFAGPWPRIFIERLLPGLAQGLFAAILGWVLYAALEPYIRRRMPDLLVGWARMLEGRLGDPRVGRDVLLGLVLGAAVATLFHAVNGLPTWLDFPAQTTIPSFRAAGPPDESRMMPWVTLATVVGDAVIRTLATFTLLYVVRLVVRRTWLTGAILWLILTGLSLGGENPALETPAAMVIALVMTFAVMRLGPLAVGAMWFAQLLLVAVPLRVDPGLWYAPWAALTLVLVVGLALWAFRTSLAGRPAFGGFTLDA